MECLESRRAAIVRFMFATEKLLQGQGKFQSAILSNICNDITRLCLEQDEVIVQIIEYLATYLPQVNYDYNGSTFETDNAVVSASDGMNTAGIFRQRAQSVRDTEELIEIKNWLQESRNRNRIVLGNLQLFGTLYRPIESYNQNSELIRTNVQSVLSRYGIN